MSRGTLHLVILALIAYVAYMHFVRKVPIKK
jgi:Tfp pilus assembly protein PilE